MTKRTTITVTWVSGCVRVKGSQHKVDELSYYESKTLPKTRKEFDVGEFLVEDLLIFQSMRKKLSYRRPLVLEVGCGSQPRSLIGLFLREESFIGSDISKTRLKFAKSSFSGSYVVCDAEHLPFRDSTFDATLALGVLHHLPSWNIGLNEIFSVTQKEGYIGLREPIYSRDLGFLSRFSSAESPHEKPIEEYSFIEKLRSLCRIINCQRVFPRIRMPITRFLFYILPHLRFSSSFWTRCWNFDIIMDTLLGGIIYLCRGATILVLAQKD